MKSTVLFVILALHSVFCFCNNGTVISDSLNSSLLSCYFKYNVYLPPSYNKDYCSKYPVLYLLHGMYGDYTDWLKKGGMDSIADRVINEGADEMIIVMPDGLDAYYCNNFDSRNLPYEDFMFQEFIPYIDCKYRTVNSRGARALAGLSMGGYGSTYYAFKYPTMFSSAYSMSGSVLKGGNEVNVMTTLNAKTSDELKCLPAYTMEIGTSDQFYTNNLKFDDSLSVRNITHKLVTREGSHEWAFWIACLPKALKFTSDNFDYCSDVTRIKSENEKTEAPLFYLQNDWGIIKTSDRGLYYVYNAAGTLIASDNYYDEEAMFYLGNLNNGVYLIKICQRSTSKVYKFLVN